LEHLFYDCLHVKQLWKDVANWIYDINGEQIIFNKSTVILGSQDNNSTKVVNWLIINIKYYIYSTKMRKNKLNIKAVQRFLEDKIEIEKCILLKNCEYEILNKYWMKWSNLFI